MMCVWGLRGCGDYVVCVSCVLPFLVTATTFTTRTCFTTTVHLVHSSLVVDTGNNKTKKFPTKVCHRHQKQQTSHQPKREVRRNHKHSRWSCSRPQEPSASGPTSGIWPAAAPCSSSSCAGNTSPRLCALWVTPPCWPAATLFSACACCEIARAQTHFWDITRIPPRACQSVYPPWHVSKCLDRKECWDLFKLYLNWFLTTKCILGSISKDTICTHGIWCL